MAVAPDLAIVPTGTSDPAREITVRVRRHAPDPIRGELRLDLPAGWSAEPRMVPVVLDDGDRELRFTVTPPPAVAPGEYPIRAVLATDHGDHDLGFQVIDYPHLDPRHMYARQPHASGSWPWR